MKIIAYIYTDFPEKFGIPRQSGLVKELKGRIVFEPAFRNPQVVQGLTEFSHIWLLWVFSECADRPWSPTVRPPRLETWGKEAGGSICQPFTLPPQ